MKINKLGFFLFILIILTSQVSGEVETLGTFKQGSCISLKQICANCTFNNITSLYAPNSQILLSNVAMTKSGTEYNYTTCSTGQLGQYIVNGVGDENGKLTVWNYDYLVTPSGNRNILGLYIIVIGIIYLISFVGFFGRNVWVSIAGGMMMIILGLFTLNNGIDIYRSFITEAFSFFTIGIGAIFALTAGIELITENI